jgi:GH18 family chitinase
MSAAVPGLPRDMLAFTHDTVPEILESVNFFNVMTYDLMNRRDNVTKHHTGVQESLIAIDAYLERGVPSDRANLGLAFYVKGFRIEVGVDCQIEPIGCATGLMEDPETGADLGKTVGFSWYDEVPSELSASFAKALEHGVYDEKAGGHYYWDESERLFWTWDNPDAIKRKLPKIFGGKKLGGVFAWGLGEDAPKFDHLRAANSFIGALSSSSPDPYQVRSEL